MPSPTPLPPTQRSVARSLFWLLVLPTLLLCQCRKQSTPPTPRQLRQSPKAPPTRRTPQNPTDPSQSVRKPAFAVIDAHTHLHPSAYGEAVTLMNRLGIRVMVNLSGGAPGGRLEAQLAASRRHPGRFVLFTTPDFSLLHEKNGPQRIAAMLKKAVQMGAKGLKIYKSLGLRLQDKQGKLLPVDTPLLDPLWRMAGTLQVPVAIHTGDPKAFFTPLNRKNERYAELSLNPHWSFADRKRFPTWDTLYTQFLRLVARHPKTTFIGLHFGNNPEDVVAVGRSLEKYPNLYVDLAARLPEIGRQDTSKLRAIFLKYQDRILFATDLAIWPNTIQPDTRKGPASFRYTTGAPMPKPPTRRDVHTYFFRHWTFLQTRLRNLKNPTPIQGAWPIHGVGLPRSVLRKIYSTNAQRLILKRKNPPHKAR